MCKSRVAALSVDNVQVHEIVRVGEEHVFAVVDVLEPLGVIGERVVTIGRVGARGNTGVLEKDTLYLVGVGRGELRVIGHDIAVGSIGHKDELALREGKEDLVKEKLANRQSRRDIGEVEGSRVEGAERVSLVDVAVGGKTAH